MASYFSIEICDDYLSEDFTVEISYHPSALQRSQLFASLDREPHEEAKIEILSNANQYAWRLSYQPFIDILKKARKDLYDEDTIDYVSSNIFTNVTKKYKGLLNPQLIKYKGFINPASAIYVLDGQQESQRLGFIVKEPGCDYEVELYPSNGEYGTWHFRYEEFLRVLIDAKAELEEYLNKNQ